MHLGASPGSDMGSGHVLEYNGGGCVGPWHALICPGLNNTNVHEKVAPVLQCVSSVATCSGVNHLPTR